MRRKRPKASNAKSLRPRFYRLKFHGEIEIALDSTREDFGEVTNRLCDKLEEEMLRQTGVPCAGINVSWSSFGPKGNDSPLIRRLDSWSTLGKLKDIRAEAY